jgi:large subunit ribosomal protein L33
MATGSRDIVTLQCSECKRRNYTTTRNKKKNQKKVELQKYCRFDRKHTLHKEVK